MRDGLAAHDGELRADSARLDAELELLSADNVPPAVTLVARPGLGDHRRAAHRRGCASRTLVAVRRCGTGGPRRRCRRARRTGRRAGRGQPAGRGWRSLPRPLEGRDRRWLDVCAGPGGKAALLAALAAPRGAQLVANEIAAASGRAGPAGGGGCRPTRSRSASATVARSGVRSPRRTTGCWSTCRAPASARCGADPSRAGGASPATSARWAGCSASCSARRSTRPVRAAWSPTSPARRTSARPCSWSHDLVRRRDDIEQLDARPVLAGLVPDGPSRRTARSATGRPPSSGRTGTAPTRCSSRCCVVAEAPYPLVGRVCAVGLQIAPSILSADFAALAEELQRIGTADWAARRRDGQPLRAQPDPRPAGRRVADQGQPAPARRAPDDRRPGPLGPGVRRGRLRQRDVPRRGGHRTDPAGPRRCAPLGARAGMALQAGHPGRAVRRPAARARHAAGHDCRAGLRRAEVPRRRAAQDRAGPGPRSRRTAARSGSRSTAASTPETIERCAEAGADVFVAGSAVYGADNAADAIAALRTAAAAVPSRTNS